ncbi:hypothetical protein [Celeribacter naphthalenivorans]|uniref:hypothetical protein n=1 Tax=Celeribacter naphthalenivorans TaxID=1614694 RepID=UPI001CFC0FDD|nr:hypothetical protein [Celeribacter naphthalenivorans]
MRDLFPKTIDKSQNGATWWRGAWECRNWNGYFQEREGGTGNWCFRIPWFSNDDKSCTVYVIAADGEITKRDEIPINDAGEILIRGKRYGREFWHH